MALLLKSLVRVTQCQQVSRLLSTSSVWSEKGLNKVQLLGRVGNFPREFTSKDARRMVAFPLVTPSSYKVKNSDGTETLTTKATWHSINVFMPSLQEIVLKYVQKGSRVFINGRIHNTKYFKDDGTEKFISVVIADDLINLHNPNRSTETETETFPKELEEENPENLMVENEADKQS